MLLRIRNTLSLACAITIVAIDQAWFAIQGMRQASSVTAVACIFWFVKGSIPKQRKTVDEYYDGENPSINLFFFKKKN